MLLATKHHQAPSHALLHDLMHALYLRYCNPCGIVHCSTIYPFLLPVVCTLFMVFVLQGCSSTKNTPYPPPAHLSQTPCLRQDFIQEFLQGRWATAASLFAQTKEELLRQDDFCAVAQLYVLAYKLHAYMGVEYPHILDKALDFSQQGLDCPHRIKDHDTLVASTQDTYFETLLQDGDWPLLFKHLKHLHDPLFVSVYARKAGTKAGQSLNHEDQHWAHIFFQQAHTIDSRQGWVLFLIQDWKLRLSLEHDPDRQEYMTKRINTLLTLITPCPQSITGP